MRIRWKRDLPEDAGIQKHVPHFELKYGDEFITRRHKTGKFRCGPVEPEPYTGIIRWFKLYYRYPKTYRTLKWNNAWEDLGIKGKPKHSSLPTCWDDIPRAKKQKSWKATRKTQYKC